VSRFTIATRESRLALWQAEHVKALLEQHGHEVALLGMTTKGDQILDRSLSKVGGKGLFVKELENALEDGRADLAVHSLKDVPMDLPPGMELACVMEREDPRDALVSPNYESVEALPPNAVVGTSSLRRIVLLRALRPDLRIEPLRGNLDTRLRKLDARSDYDALVLAAAGLKRLEHAERISALLPVDACVPAPGQGIIAVEVRAGDQPVLASVAAITDPDAAAALTAERAVVTRLGGGCQMPIGAYAAFDAGELAITAIVVSVDGSQAARTEARGSAADAHAIGITAAEQLLERGAGDILGDVLRAHGAVEGLQP
jgi:hydroxymethylbilane synthase